MISIINFEQKKFINTSEPVGKALNRMAVALKSIRQLLYFFGLGSETSITLMKLKVNNNVICIFVIISQVYFIIPYILFAIDNDILLSAINGPIYVILCIVLMIFIYIDLIRNKSFLNQTFSFLDEFINEGEANHFIMKNKKRSISLNEKKN